MAYRKPGERCPECGAPDPPPLRTCASETCGRQFRRSEGGRPDAIYCRRKCAKAQAERQRRRRAKARRDMTAPEDATTESAASFSATSIT